MKRIFPILLLVALLCTVIAGCGKAETSPSDRTPSEISMESSKPDSTLPNTSEDTMYIMIGEHTLNVKNSSDVYGGCIYECDPRHHLLKAPIAAIRHYGSFMIYTFF